MNIRRIQGLALIIGAVCLLLGFVVSEAAAGVLAVLGILLFIFGIPAVNASQPSGSIGLIGVGLMILSAAIALGFRLGVLGDTDLEDALIATSIISGLAGRLITGWLTIQKRVFSQWWGWALMATGVLNAAWLINLGSEALGVVVVLLEAVALAGYGVQILQKNTGNSKVGVGLR